MRVDLREGNRVSQVKTVHSDDAANSLLQEGWRLFHAGVCHIDSDGFNAKPVMILVKLEKEE